MLLTSRPFVVANPVQTTIPNDFTYPAQVRITSVPENKVFFLSNSGL